MAATSNSVLITGTTSGVGRALLDHYVRQGATVIAVNRRTVPELESQYPLVRFAHIDVRCAEEVDQLIRGLVGAEQLPDIFILNAGINRVDNDERFQLSVYKEVVDTNLFGVLNFVAPLTQVPTSRSPRHVIAISSVASYVGNPYGLGYHTSKRALTACFDTWAKMYTDTDLIFQQVMLGPVHTNIYTMESRFPAWMVKIKHLSSASLASTVRAISRLALTRKKKLFFPKRAIPLVLAMGLGQRLVPGLYKGRKTLSGDTRRTG